MRCDITNFKLLLLILPSSARLVMGDGSKIDDGEKSCAYVSTKLTVQAKKKCTKGEEMIILEYVEKGDSAISVQLRKNLLRRCQTSV